MYVHGEYLIGWLDGMNTPPLVIQDDNANFTSPDIIYGDGPLLEGQRNGGRITFGLWLDDYGKWGIEGDYLGLGDLNETFTAGTKDGQGALNNIYIGRPFFNPFSFFRDPPSNMDEVPRGPAREDDTDGLDGTVSVYSHSEFQSAGIRLLHNLCCVDRNPPCCGDSVECGSAVGCGSGCGAGVDCPIRPLGRICSLLGLGVRRTDVIYGFRWASLNESLRIDEDLQEVEGDTEFLITDLFETSNDFYGGEIGFQTQWERHRWSLDLLSKIAIGNTQQRVLIDGYTFNDGVLSEDLTVDGRRGGLLAQSGEGAYAGNIGSYQRDAFSVLPELGLTLGYAVTPRLRATVGYTLIYWSNVLRPGDQIDLDVNGTLIPSGELDPIVVARDHPRFEYRQTDLWAQFLNVGAEYRW